MRSAVLNRLMLFINNGSYSKEDLEKIHYGLEAIYIFITKGIVIFTISYILGLLKYTLIFLLFYGILRSFACGLHAASSFACLIASTLVFIIIPYLCKTLIINRIFCIAAMVLSLLLMIKYAPADTKKRPIVNNKKRKKLKYISVFFSTTYIILALIVKKNIILNSLMFGLVFETIMILPITYKLFGLPYNNYINYLKTNK